ALAGQTRVFGPKHPNNAYLLGNIANVLDDLGDHAGAVSYSERATAIAEAAGPNSAEVAQMKLNLAIYLRGMGQFERAYKTLEAVRIRRSELLGPNHALVGEVEHFMATVFLAERRLVEAEAHAKLALPVIEGALSAQHPM